MKSVQKSQTVLAKKTAIDVFAEKLRLEPLRVEQPLADLESTGKKRVENQTARKAAQILVEKNEGFLFPLQNKKKESRGRFCETGHDCLWKSF